MAKTMNLAKIYQNRRNNLNKMIISYLVNMMKIRPSFNYKSDNMAKGPLVKWRLLHGEFQ